jgi:hypothetical protein
MPDSFVRLVLKTVIPVPSGLLDFQNCACLALEHSSSSTLGRGIATTVRNKYLESSQEAAFFFLMFLSAQ